MTEPITEEWPREVGFKSHQLERQPEKQWLLWLGGACRDGFAGDEDLGIELVPNRDKTWFCWLRGDYSHRYSRFIHVRYLRMRDEVIKLVEACTGQTWNPENHWHGRVLLSEHAERARSEDDRRRCQSG